jgi:hypothetical protein
VAEAVAINAPGSTERSRSDLQEEVEALIRARLSKELDVDLTPRRLWLDGGAYVDVDGVAPDESVLVEIFAHQGRLKGGQRHKVQGDALKLVTLARSRPASKLIIAFCDQEAADGVVGWLAEALDGWRIERRVVKLPDGVRAGLRAAQVRQVMVNPSPIDSDEGQ